MSDIKDTKEFKERYKVCIKDEQVKIRIDKKLKDEQKKERLAALEDMLKDIEER